MPKRRAQEKRAFMKLVFISLAFGLVACSHNISRGPQSESSLPQTIDHYFSLSQNSLTNDTCSAALKEIRQNLSEEKVQSLSSAQIKTSSDDMMEKLFQIRLHLHDQLPNIKDCKSELHDTFYQLRYMEELLALESLGLKNQRPSDFDFFKQPIPLKADEKYYGYRFRHGYNLNNLQFRSGDIMVTRGVSFFSAALTRIPNVDGQFSHFVMVHVDDKTGKVSTMESYAQTGGVTDFDINYALQNENARILLLRPKDQALAKKAADLMMKKILDLKAKKKQIPYDYAMDVRDPSSMTCAEVAHWSYRWASDDKFNLPENKSAVIRELVPFMKSVGMPNAEILAPRDMELDSRFDVIAEFRDYRILRDMMYRDMILTKMYDWMSKEGYVLNHNLKTLFATNIVWPIRRTPAWPLVRKALGVSDFPKGTPRSFFSTYNKLNEVGDVIYEKLEAADANYKKETGTYLTTQQLGETLEAIRKKDLEAYQNGDRKTFHNMLRNPKQVVNPQENYGGGGN
jgi:hypothetical protein